MVTNISQDDTTLTNLNELSEILADNVFESFDDGLYIGMMSGTSLDALDAVLCRFIAGKAELVATHSQPFEPNLRAVLMALCQPNGTSELTDDVIVNLGFANNHIPKSELDWAGWASVAYAKFASIIIDELLEKSQTDGSDILAIGCHGQTIRHRPEWGFTWQLLDPNVLAQRTGISVVSDFRRRDMAVQGQGAPLAPAFHVAQFSDDNIDRIVVNLGGIANITVLPAGQPDAVFGFDTGPASSLLDAWYQFHVKQKQVPEQFMQTELYDTDGNWAKSGRANLPLLTQLLSHPYFALPAPKSTGREDFNLAWLNDQLEAIGTDLSPTDVQATLTALTVQTLATTVLTQSKTLHIESGQLIICGGGAYNSYLLTKLKEALPNWQVMTANDFGVAPTWIEAMAFAWLARQTLMGETGNLPAVTGADKGVVLGQVCFA